MHSLIPLACLLTVPAIVATAPADDPSTRLRAFENLLNTRDDAVIDRFIDEQLAPAYVREIGRDGARELLEELREKCGNFGGIMIQPLETEGFEVRLDSDRGEWTVRFELESASPYRVTGLSIEPFVREAGIEPFTWEDLGRRLDEYEAQGFGGSVLVCRDGQVVLHRGYGMSDPERGVPNEPDTIFAIGSTPIDFTRAAILLLEERGELSTADSITEYFEDVPRDKRAITLRHLMTGASGLANFHGIHGVDENLDLTYIDRDEAMRRIFAGELLFAPGEGDAHSHSAWGVLAAVVEIVSGTEYHEFLQRELFEPAGMTRTGPYPITLGFDESEVALGITPNGVGERNSPRHWGETSWLVTGSGGMVSTTIDLARWFRALADGRLLGDDATRRYWGGGVGQGGNDRGFVCTYVENPHNQSIVISNTHVEYRDVASQIGEGLARLVLDGGEAYSIGLAADLGDAQPTIVRVVKESPAARAGLRRGDVVVEACGLPSDEFAACLKDSARRGTKLDLVVDRDGDRVKVSIVPEK